MYNMPTKTAPPSNRPRRNEHKMTINDMPNELAIIESFFPSGSLPVPRIVAIFDQEGLVFADDAGYFLEYDGDSVILRKAPLPSEYFTRGRDFGCGCQLEPPDSLSNETDEIEQFGSLSAPRKERA
jgi:hypothetical protein